MCTAEEFKTLLTGLFFIIVYFLGYSAGYSKNKINDE
jgi:hypothetical protein